VMAIRRWISTQRSLFAALMIKFQLLHLLTSPDKSQNIYEKRCPTELSHHIINIINTFRPALVLVPTGLSRHQSGVGTSTKPIFISLLKKKYWA
jgi:hypothetical protein